MSTAPFLTVSEAAAILKCSPDLVRYFERNGRLAAIKTERGWRLFRREDVERLATDRASRQEAGDRS
jgi:excisionase family DNA binding protein